MLSGNPPPPQHPFFFFFFLSLFLHFSKKNLKISGGVEPPEPPPPLKYALELNDTKTAYLSDKITKCDGNPKLLHKLIDKLLVNQHQQQLPSHDNDELLANKFAEFFEDKIDKIRSNFTINNIDEIHHH